MLPDHLKTTFHFGTSQVGILTGDIFNLELEPHLQALVLPEDNYLTMSSPLSRRLQDHCGKITVQRAQASSPVRAGTVIVSEVRKGKAKKVQADTIFHAVVIDYDFEGRTLDELLVETCLESLRKAEEKRISCIAIQVPPAEWRGMSMGSAARSLCSAIKLYLAEERPVKGIWLVLDSQFANVPGSYDDGNGGKSRHDETITRMTDFVREANAILGSPYDPQERVRQARDFFGRETEMRVLVNLLDGQIPGKRHGLLLGGPAIGKWMLLDQLYYRSQVPGDPLSQGRMLVRVGFTAQLPEGEPSFLYRKLVKGMLRQEQRPAMRKLLDKTYASPVIDASQLKLILEYYRQESISVCFLCDGFPQGVIVDDPMAGEAAHPSNTALLSFYRALEAIQEQAVFLISTHEDNDFETLSQQFKALAAGFFSNLESFWVRVVSDVERTEWVNAVYQRYLNTTKDAPLDLQRFVEEEAGNHPYTISLACFLMLNRMKRVALNSPKVIEQGWGRVVLKGIVENARRQIAAPRRILFDHLIERLPHAECVDLYNLARAVMAEEQTRLLGPALATGDPNAQARLADLLLQGETRDLLHKESIDWLINQGYVIKRAGGKELLSIPALASRVLEKLGGFNRPEERPADITISLLHHVHQAAKKHAERSTIRTLFNSRGGRVIAAEKNFARDLRADFMENFNLFLEARRGNKEETTQSVFRTVEEVGNFLLSQYATLAVKRYLENPPPGCTINFLVDDSLKDIPWELMLEASYAGEIPFQVGRSIISNQAPGNVRPAVRGPGKIKPLLIGNPTGDLESARYEVEWLEEALSADTRFDCPDVLSGTESCQRIQVLNALSSGLYGLVHYSGHSRASGEKSAWGLSDGEATVDQLTSALQAAPPAMVFSSSCFSGAGGESLPVEYESQSFDLPGAFLSAGVDAYVGTLWEVEEDAARRLVERFYTAFLQSDLPLGECLRRARQSLKLEQERSDKIDWLAFILYGDPRLMPGDLYPAFRS